MTGAINNNAIVSALTGSEIVYVIGKDANSNLAAATEKTTTGNIAALASGGSTTTVATALSTVGAGTITAAGIYGKITTRSGSQSGTPFTDTTDTAAAIIALLPTGAATGTAFQYTYVNNTNAVATITGGTGVTVSGITSVPSNSWARYLFTYTAANTATLVGIEAGAFASLGTVTLTGTTAVTVSNTNVTVNSDINFTLQTVGGTVGASPVIKTITSGTGFTVAGTAGDTSVYNYRLVY